MSRVLVTGATGFLGSAIVGRLQKLEVPVRTTGRALKADHLPNYWPADLTQTVALPQMLDGVSCVLHCAGLAHQFSSRKMNRLAYHKINCQAAERLAREAATQGVRRFVYLSSVSVYGPSTEAWLRNENATPAPVGPYATSKRQAEVRLLRTAADTGLQVFILRMATLYGEDDPGNVSRLIEAIKRGRFVMVGSGKNEKSLLHKEDAARACVQAAVHPADRPVGIWNVAARPQSMNEIVETISKAVGRQAPQKRMPPALVKSLLWTGANLGIGPFRKWSASRFATVEKWLSEDAYDGSRFSREFHWEPLISLEAGLERMTEQNVVASEGMPVAVLDAA